MEEVDKSALGVDKAITRYIKRVNKCIYITYLRSWVYTFCRDINSHIITLAKKIT